MWGILEDDSVTPFHRDVGLRVHIFRNPHPSARAALEHWQKCGLWGDPIQLGPDKFHVYGASRKRWTTLNVEFTAKQIVCVRHGLNRGG